MSTELSTCALEQRCLLPPAAGELSDNLADKRFRIAKKHQCLVEIVQRVVDSRETGTHPALDYHDHARLIDIENRHTVDRATGIVASGGNGHTGGPDHHGKNQLRELGGGIIQ